MRSTPVDRRRWLLNATAAIATGPAALCAARAQADGLVIGVVPNVSARVIAAQYQPLRDHLATTLQRPVRVVTAADFATFADRCREGQYDLAVTAANLGALALADGQMRAMGITEPGIPALAVALRDQAAAALSRLPGRRLALGNPASLVALRGLAWLREQGLEEGRDFTATRAPNEDSLARWLDSGDAPLALMSRGELNQLSPARQQTLAVVQQFAVLPGFMMLAPMRLPADQLAALGQALAAFFGGPQAEAFRAGGGPGALRELTRADLAQLEPFVDATRRALAGLRG